MKLLTKLAVAAVACITASTLVASAAYAKVEPIGEQGNFVILSDAENSACALAIANEKSGLVIAYTLKDGSHTGITYLNTDLPDMTGEGGDVTLVVDNDEYDWQAQGGEHSFTMVSDDPSVPARLKAAKVFGVESNDQLIFALQSDDDFDAAMDKVVECAKGFIK